MDENLPSSREKLTEEFFHRQNAELLAKMREDLGIHEQRAKLESASGIHSRELLDELIQVKITPETLAALKLVPLIFVAWADKEIQSKERELIMDAAQRNQMPSGGEAYRLLESWLQQPPPASLLEAWKDYIGELSSTLTSGAVRMLREEVLDGAEAVALSAGGFLGFGSLAKSEAAVIQELHDAFPGA